MIDAYEIGIRLLLQDDVSAGLAVISQGLAEVDRGIAATSAHLTALVHQSETAAKAVAAVAGKTITPSVPQATNDPIRSEAREAGQEQKGSIVPPAAAPQVAVTRETLVGPSARSGRDVEPPEPSAAPKATSPATSAERDRPRVIEEVSKTPGVPTMVVTAPDYIPAVSKPSTSDDAELSTAVPRTQVMPVSELPVGPGKPIGQTLPSAASVAPSNPPGVDKMATVTASVASSRADLVQSTSKPASVNREAQQSPERTRPSAPRSDVVEFGKPKELGRSNERSSAPSSQTRERSDSVGGAVMLDGRLVGQWLSEHMAQEASRPPGGTSFFDPRQTPAWTISGAI